MLGNTTSAVEVTHVSKHGFWPQLDADLSVQSIRDPSGFPLVSKTQPSMKDNP